MWLLAMITVFLAAALLHFYLDRKRKYKDVQKLPGPPTQFFFGNALEFGTNSVESFQSSQRIIRTYGPLVRIWFGPFRLNLFVTDIKLVEYFLSSNVHTKKSAGYDLYRPWLGFGLAMSSGNLWKKQRKLLSPAFHFNILDEFSKTFNAVGKVFIAKLAGQIGKDVNICPLVAMYALDAIFASMRIDAGVQKNSDTTYLDAEHLFLEIFAKRFFSIFKCSDFIYQFTSEGKKSAACVVTLKEIARKVVQQRREVRLIADHAMDQYDTRNKRNVFLDILLDSDELTDEEICEHVNTFLFAGQDTVTAAISFCLFEIAKHPHVQQNILENLEDVVGKDKSVEITVKNLQEMSYLDRVIKEVLRLYPPVPLYERELMEEVVFGSTRIPKGTTISFHPFAQHHNEELFPDPEKFNPDRFLPENISRRNAFAYIPFSAGPRNCIGQKYAILNVKTTVANVVRNFELHTVIPEHKPLLASDAVLRSANGLPIKLKLRQ